jgi:hypothetical protein
MKQTVSIGQQKTITYESLGRSKAECIQGLL